MSDFVIANGVLEKYTSPGGDVVIPKRVTSIGWGAFYGCSSLTSIVLPERVTSIGDRAFWGCSRLKSIVLPENVTYIGGHAFNDCSSATITLPASFDLTKKREYCLGKNTGFGAHTLVRMMMYQTHKDWKEAIPTLHADPAALYASLNELLGSKKKISKGVAGMLTAWILDHKKKLTAETINPLYQFLLKHYPDSAAVLAHDQAIAAMLDTNDGGEETFIIENGVLTAINDSGMSIVLPDKITIAPDALKNAQYVKIMVPESNTSLTMAWYAQANISAKVKELDIAAGALLFMLKAAKEYLPFSADVKNVLKVSGKIPTDLHPTSSCFYGRFVAWAPHRKKQHSFTAGSSMWHVGPMWFLR